MDTLKEASIETIKRLPDGCTVEEIMYQINLIAQVLEGTRYTDAGRVMTTEQLLQMVKKWGN